MTGSLPAAPETAGNLAGLVWDDDDDDDEVPKLSGCEVQAVSSERVAKTERAKVKA